MNNDQDCPTCGDHPMGMPLASMPHVFVGEYIPPTAAEMALVEQAFPAVERQPMRSSGFEQAPGVGESEVAGLPAMEGAAGPEGGLTPGRWPEQHQNGQSTSVSNPWPIQRQVPQPDPSIGIIRDPNDPSVEYLSAMQIAPWFEPNIGFKAGGFLFAIHFPPGGLLPSLLEKAKRLLRKYFGASYENLPSPQKEWLEAILARILASGRIEPFPRPRSGGFAPGTRRFVKPRDPQALGTEENCVVTDTRFAMGPYDFTQLVDILLWQSDSFITPHNEADPDSWTKEVKEAYDTYLAKCRHWESYFTEAVLKQLREMVEFIFNSEGWSLADLYLQVETDLEDYSCIEPCKKYVTVEHAKVTNHGTKAFKVICKAVGVYPENPQPGEQTYSRYEVRLRWEVAFHVGQSQVLVECK